MAKANANKVPIVVNTTPPIPRTWAYLRYLDEEYIKRQERRMKRWLRIGKWLRQI